MIANLAVEVLLDFEQALVPPLLHLVLAGEPEGNARDTAAPSDRCSGPDPARCGPACRRTSRRPTPLDAAPPAAGAGPIRSDCPTASTAPPRRGPRTAHTARPARPRSARRTSAPAPRTGESPRGHDAGGPARPSARGSPASAPSGAAAGSPPARAGSIRCRAARAPMPESARHRRQRSRRSRRNGIDDRAPARSGPRPQLRRVRSKEGIVAIRHASAPNQLRIAQNSSAKPGNSPATCMATPPELLSCSHSSSV